MPETKTNETESPEARAVREACEGAAHAFNTLIAEDEEVLAHLRKLEGGDELVEEIRMAAKDWTDATQAFLESLTRHPHPQPLGEWLDTVREIKEAHKNPTHYWSPKLGNPKFDNALDVLCYEKGMSPQEALDWWKAQ